MTRGVSRLPRLIASGALAAACTAFAAQMEAGSLAGTVKDRSGAAVPNAEVSLLTPLQAVLATARTDAQGAFSFSEAHPGSYLLLVRAKGLPPRRSAVQVGSDALSVDVLLDNPRLSEEVTVTAEPGGAAGTGSLAQPVNVLSEDDLGWRTKAVVAQLANEEVGVHLQRTAPSMAGIFVRGLTGAKVNVYVDGQRYSTGAARGGVNTFLDLVDPASLEGVEILRGPSSAQYGSDALGGSVQFLTRTPALSTTGSQFSGSYSLGGNSADKSLGAHLTGQYSGSKLAVLGTLSGRHLGDVRTGKGTDSHNALLRFLGVDPEPVLDGGRLPGTGFDQYGGLLKLNWAPSTQDRVVMSYMRGQQEDGKRYDQLLGGDGNLIADLRHLVLDRASLRYDRGGLGPFDTLALGYSYNGQREERVNQGGNGNPRATINHEPEKIRVHGVQGSLGKSWRRQSLLVGGDFYSEKIDALSFGENAVTFAQTARRGRVPHGASYRHGGAYVQDSYEAVPGKLRLIGNLRYSHASYEQNAADSPLVGGRPLWPDDSEDFSSVTFRAGAVVTPNEAWTLSANVARGFRAPHITDLGTVGLTGSGYEVTPSALAGLGATIGSSAAATATSTGRPADRLAPERSLSYEAGLQYHRGTLHTAFSAFINDIKGNIQKQALILPQGAVGLVLGGELVTRQDPNGTVFVAASSSAVLVNANFDDARIWGIEHTLDWRPTDEWTLGTVFTYMRAKDERTDLPPNIEGGTPAPDGWLRLRYAPAGKRWWAEPYFHVALRQTHLSSLDLEDRRTGAGRSRSSIASFFANGARARGLIGAGADGVAGNADDVLLSTGETLAQVQARVLGSANSSSLFTEIPGYVTINLRGGFRLAQGHELQLDVENITDKNYRGISWGVDAPGFGVAVRYVGRF